jgi:Cof subfamily protein (haloacid dehalogenase superfamily)
MIKLLLMDLDGTLLDDRKRLSPEDIYYIRKVAHNGVIVSLATGRSLGSAFPYVEQLNIDVPAILQNGALVCKPLSREIIFSGYLQGTLAVRIVEEARRKNVFYVVFDKFFNEKDMLIDKEYLGPHSYYFKMNGFRIRKVDDVVEYINDRVVEIALVGAENMIEEVAREVNREYNGKYSYIKNVVVDGESFIEFLGSNISKGNALSVLLSRFGIRREETMFVGDGFNDVSLMKEVGLPVAMSNAADDVKKFSKYVTKSNNESGVGFAIKELLLED